MSQKTKKSEHPFERLDPTLILDAVSEQGFQPTGVFYPLNSYENRVYEIKLEEEEPLVAKFYRPERWPLQGIVEEHLFIDALDELEIPVVAPYFLDKPISQSDTLGEMAGFHYALYPKFRGRENPDLSSENREWLGRSLARLHKVGEHFKAKHRIHLSPQSYGHDSLQFILSQDFLPSDLKQAIENTLLQAIRQTEIFFQRPYKEILLHGDCHLGNVLWNKDGPYLLDFDDMVHAPAVQDLWMLFHGKPEEVRVQREAFFKGYESFREFDYSELQMSEALRTLRMIRYAAWVGERYREEIFIRAFPYYRERRYWEDFLLNMKEQISAMQDVEG